MLGFNPNSYSGAFSFSRQLVRELLKRNHQFVESEADAALSIIVTSKPDCNHWVLRLDGIHIDSKKNHERLNLPIAKAYHQANVVVAQSEFNKRLLISNFGPHPDLRVINNGVDISEVEKAIPLDKKSIRGFENIWCCASEWRAHKRLEENIRYFLEFSSPNDALIVAGRGVEDCLSHPRIFYYGWVERQNLLSIYKRSKYFLHLAFCDHCPNVVVDARASGCHIVCASSGGTSEIAGSNSTIVQDIDWAGIPLDMQHPPALDFNKRKSNAIDSVFDIKKIAELYEYALMPPC